MVGIEAASSRQDLSAMSAILREQPRNPPADEAHAAQYLPLGWAPALAITMALGLVLVCVADSEARAATHNAVMLFWVGLALAVVPVALRVATPRATITENMTLVTLLGTTLYLFKVAHSPTQFTFHDEFLHERTAYNILTNHHLFRSNPLLPVSAFYPGLEIVTSALSHLTGLSLFVSGLIVIGVARVIAVLALFLIYHHFSRSSQLAGIATVVYLANPNSVFFSAQFAYESLALPLTLLTLLALLRRGQFRERAWAPFTIVAVVLLIAVVATHHLTTYILTLLLLWWTAVYLWCRRRGPVTGGPGWAALLALVAGMLWLAAIGPITIHYLAPHVQATAQEITGLAERFPSTGRQPFQAPSGVSTPSWERASSIAASLLLAATIPFGLWTLRRRLNGHAFAISLALASLLYPASLALRLTASGWEIANRSSEFIFLALGFVVAAAILWLSLPATLARMRPVLFAVFAVVIFIGGIVSGWPPTWLMPGPYLPAAGPQSIDSQGVADALWARDALGPGRKFGGDRVNDLLLGSYGDEDPESTLNGGVDTSWLFFAPHIGPEQVALIRQGHLRYILTDMRLTTSRPNDSQFDGSAPERYYYATRPIASDLLIKFSHLHEVSRIFNSGSISIYDVGIYDRRSAATPNPATAAPMPRRGAQASVQRANTDAKGTAG
jgi:hypothetical protein